MLKAARNLFRRFGFASALLLALAFAMPAPASPACAPDDEPSSLISVLPQADDCGSEACEDCGLTCSQGCCHAPHPAVAGSTAAVLSTGLLVGPRSHADAYGSPARLPDGPERPPRA